MGIIAFLGMALAIYGFYGLITGQVYAKDKWSGGYIYRSERPAYFYLVCICYIVVGGMIFFI